MKAPEVAEGLGLRETPYSRYKRGEAAITVDIIQKVAEMLKVDPVTLMTQHPGNFISIGQGVGDNSPVGIHGYYNHQTKNEDYNRTVLQFFQNMLTIS